MRLELSWLNNIRLIGLKTTVARPGNIQFYWKTSTGYGYDNMQFLVDGLVLNQVVGQVDWATVSYELGPGNHVLRWTYNKNSYPVWGQGAGWLAQVHYEPVATHTSPWIITESNDATITFGGAAQFSLLAQGSDVLNFQWYKDGFAINNAPGLVNDVRTTTLSITNVQPSDVGDYYAVVSNPYGSVTSKVVKLSLLQNVTIKKTESWPDCARGTSEPRNVAVMGIYAYVTDINSPRLFVYDISNPASPQEAGGCMTSYYLQGLAVTTNYVYTASGYAGLEVIDIHNPTNPKRIAKLNVGGFTTAVAVSGNYAYITDITSSNAALHIIDISNPETPQLVGECRSCGSALGIEVIGNNAYLAVGSAGLAVIDVKNPANPQLVGSYHSSGNICHVTVSGNYAYLSAGETGLEIIDISNPLSPQHVSGYDTAGYANDIVIHGDYAFLADMSRGLQIFDIGNPANLQHIGEFRSTGNNNSVFSVAVSGNYACVGTFDGIQIIDVSNPANPAKVGNSVGGGANGIAVEGKYVYVADSGNGLQIIDVSDSNNLYRVGGCRNGIANKVAVAGNYAYVAGTSPNFQVVDITDPISPRNVAEWRDPKGSIYTNSGSYYYISTAITVKGTIAYLAGRTSLTIFDISKPANPVVIGECTATYGANSITIKDGYAYLASSGLTIIDVSNPSNPIMVGQYPGRDTMDAVVIGDYAYLASSTAGLDIVDIRNPANPHRVGLCKTSKKANGVAVVGHYAYLATGSDGGGVEIIDIGNPSNPQIVGQDLTCSSCLAVAVQGNNVYLSGGKLVVFQLSGISPVMVQNPSSQLARPGNQVTLNGWASGTQPVSYQWTFNGSVLSGQTNASLLIRSLAANQLGLYSLIASNTSGSVTSETALLAEAILAPEPFAVTDDFNDNARNPNYWGEPQPIATGGSLMENNGRLELSGVASIVRPFIGGKPSYTRNWEAITDVSIGDIPLDAIRSRVQMYLAVANSGDTNLISGLPGDNFYVALDLRLDNYNAAARSINACSNTNGTEIVPIASIATTNLHASLRITFDVVTKTLSAWYDPNGSEDGYQWTALRSVVVNSSDSDWQMNSDSTFQVFLGGSSTIWNVATNDLVYADNFKLIEEANPLSLTITRIGNVPQLTVAGTIGQQIDIEYSDSLANASSWKLLTSLTLTNTSQSVTDSTLNGTQTRYYRITLKR